jgi:tripartite-type tricarboxylate transporter receptor subunit TctC
MTRLRRFVTRHFFTPHLAARHLAAYHLAASHLAACTLATLALTAREPASAQTSTPTWPTAKPITLVAPFPPGPALDLVARLAGLKLGSGLGQTVVVENRVGANGTIGANMIARATPDGYALLATTASTHVTAVHLMKNLPYDPVRDFTPIIAAVEPVTCLAVNAAQPVNSVAELIDYARRRPGELSFGSSGVGSVFHLMGELFNQTAGVTIKHVPYRGVAPAMQDVAGGHIEMTFISISNALGPMQDGHVKILAVLEPTRFGKLPDIRSMTEIVPTFRKPSSWFGFFGPPGLPAPILMRLNGEIGKALNAPDVKPTLDDNGLAVIGGSPEQFAALIRDGIERYGAIIKRAGIKPE